MGLGVGTQGVRERRREVGDTVLMGFRDGCSSNVDVCCFFLFLGWGGFRNMRNKVEIFEEFFGYEVDS